MAYQGNSEQLRQAATDFGAALSDYDKAKDDLNAAITEALNSWSGSAAVEMAAIKDAIQSELNKIDSNLSESQKIFNQSATDNDNTDQELANAIKNV